MLLNAMVVGCELERAKSKHNLSRLVVVLAELAQLTQTTVLWRAHPLSKSLWWCVLSKLPSIVLLLNTSCWRLRLFKNYAGAAFD